ncbi:uncharacterized protein LOC126326506 [Schistocerca gregaria]|uniref:uncharacterized protein LOC126326506 n=1 Tax=Schistocerca gregaria TaxID=7010 RepID=UPI00211E31C7|nr:uncharacterized protein LOC126326506 [Schistocerca gregaria]
MSLEGRHAPLRAVILADAFDHLLAPFTLEKSKVLLSLVGVPLLNYTIEFLALSEVSQIYVLASEHADEVEEYVNSLSRRGFSGVDVSCVKFQKSQSVGDILRDSRLPELLQSDFILVYGDIISNQNLQPVWQKHMRRREKDKNALMTLVLGDNSADAEIKARRELCCKGQKQKDCFKPQQDADESLASEDRKKSMRSFESSNNRLVYSVPSAASVESAADVEESDKGRVEEVGALGEDLMFEEDPEEICFGSHKQHLENFCDHTESADFQWSYLCDLQSASPARRNSSSFTAFGELHENEGFPISASLPTTLESKKADAFVDCRTEVPLSSRGSYPPASSIGFESSRTRQSDLMSLGGSALSSALDRLVSVLSTYEYMSVSAILANNEGRIVVVDEETDLVLLYEDKLFSRFLPHLELETGLFKDHANLLCRANVLESGVFICAPEVLDKFQENFDYKSLSQFVRTMINDEVQDVKIHASFVPEVAYSTRVSSWRRYHQVSIDLLRRWAFPLVPEARFLGTTSFTYCRPGIYKEQDVHLSMSCQIGEDSAIGARTRLGSETKVRSSTIGRDCMIGNRVTIVNSFLWDGVTVQDGTLIECAVVCSHVKIGFNCKISRGCILGHHVEVGDRTELKGYTKWTHQKLKFKNAVSDGEDNFCSTFEKGDFLDQRPRTPPFPIVSLAPFGTGFLFPYPALPFQELCIGWETKSDLLQLLKVLKQNSAALSDSLLDHSSVIASSPPSELRPLSPLFEEPPSNIAETTDREKFSLGVDEIVRHALSPGRSTSADTILLEVNALKYAYDRTFLDCADAIFSSLINASTQLPGSLSSSLSGSIDFFSPVLKSYVQSVDDQVEFIFVLETVFEREPRVTHLFEGTLNRLYQNAVISEDAFFQWEKECASANPDEAAFCRRCERFLNWLREAEEEEEEE